MFLIINFGSSKTPQIAEVINDLGFKATIIPWKDNFTLNDQVEGLILSGAPILLTQVDQTPYLEKFLFLRETQVPVLGICFGHQLTGLLHGAEAYLGAENRTNTKIDHNASHLFLGLKNPCDMMEDHTEGINLPEGFVSLASSKEYELEAMRHSSKKMFGVQFHPEVSGENGRILLNNFCQLALK